MKKKRILVIIISAFVFTLFISCKNEKTNEDIVTNEETTIANNIIHQDPPVMIRLDREELNMLRKAKKNGESATKEYLKSINREELSYSDVSYLLDLIDTLHVPSINDMKKDVSILYYPEKDELYFLYVIDGQNQWYRFELSLDAEKRAKRKSEIIQKGDGNIIDIDIGENQKVKLILKVDMSQYPDLAKYYAEFWIEIDGYLIKVVYKNQSMDISKASANDIINSFWNDTQKKLN